MNGGLRGEVNIFAKEANEGSLLLFAVVLDKLAGTKAKKQCPNDDAKTQQARLRWTEKGMIHTSTFFCLHSSIPHLLDTSSVALILFLFSIPRLFVRSSRQLLAFATL